MVFVLAAVVLGVALLVTYLKLVPRTDMLINAALEAVEHRSDEELASAVQRFLQAPDVAEVMKLQVSQSPESRGSLCQVLAEAGRQGMAAELLEAGDALLEHRRALTDMELFHLVLYIGELPLEQALGRLQTVWKDESCHKSGRMLAIRVVGLKAEEAHDELQRAAAEEAASDAWRTDDCELRITALVASARLGGSRNPEFASKLRQTLEMCPQLADDHRIEYLSEFYPTDIP